MCQPESTGGCTWLRGEACSPSVDWVQLDQSQSTEARGSSAETECTPVWVGSTCTDQNPPRVGSSCTSESTIAFLSGDIRQPQSVWDGYTCTDHNPPRVGSVVQTNPPSPFSAETSDSPSQCGMGTLVQTRIHYSLFLCPRGLIFS